MHTYSEERDAKQLEDFAEQGAVYLNKLKIAIRERAGVRLAIFVSLPRAWMGSNTLNPP